MNGVPESYWSGTAERFDAALLNDLKQRLSAVETVYLTVGDIRRESIFPVTEIRALLDDMTEAGHLRKVQNRPCPACRKNLDDEEVERLRCSCGETLREDAVPQQVLTYIRDGETLRDIRWAVSIHGMNTPGLWQQDLSWRFAQMYGYSIPVGIYKYGNVKLSPLVLFRQRTHRDRLLAYLHKMRDEMSERYGERPDVIAHSFGTWLLSAALMSDSSSKPLQLGRVILTGSIVRPDFNWKALLDAGRIEAVLCHCGAKDVPVRIAQYFIPGSGPSGRRGFNDQSSVQHVNAPTFGHSDCFTSEHLESVMRATWSPFLRRSAKGFGALSSAVEGLPSGNWRPSAFRFLTHTIKYALLACLAAFVVLSLASVPVGLPALIRSLPSLIGTAG
jgi:hypothetical protein